eukprot:2666556-Rhodomonas_salina.2
MGQFRRLHVGSTRDSLGRFVLVADRTALFDARGVLVALIVGRVFQLVDVAWGPQRPRVRAAAYATPVRLEQMCSAKGQDAA